MKFNLSKDNFLILKLKRNSKKYNIDFIIKNKYINYEIFSKFKYVELISIVENIENMIFCKYRNNNEIELKRIKFEFDQFKTKIKIIIKIFDSQEYAIILNRGQVITLYNYLIKNMNTLNKINMMNLYKKYTYVEVRYIDVYSSRRYSYISDDKSIKIGDIVYVDRAGTKCLAVVENKEDYFFEDVPYPVLETKRVINIVTRAREYNK